MPNAFGIRTSPLQFVHTTPPEAQPLFRDALHSIACAILGPSEEAQDVTESWWRQMSSASVPEAELIAGFREVLSAHGDFEKPLTASLEERAELITSQIQPYIDARSCLDWGCGDALVARQLAAQRELDIALLDISDQRSCLSDAEFFLYDESSFPDDLRGRSFDSVLLLTVLHHARQPGRTLRHAASVSRRQVILIESVPEVKHPCLNKLDVATQSFVRYEYCGFVDWVYNRVLHANVQVTFNYLHSAAWAQLGESADFTISHEMSLGIDQPLVPEHHHLIVLERD